MLRPCMPAGEQNCLTGHLEPFLFSALVARVAAPSSRNRAPLQAASPVFNNWRDRPARTLRAPLLARLFGRSGRRLIAPRKPFPASAKARKIATAPFTTVGSGSNADKNSRFKRRIVVMFGPSAKFRSQTLGTTREPPQLQVHQWRFKATVALPAAKRQNADNALKAARQTANLRTPNISRPTLWASAKRSHVTLKSNPKH